MRASLSLLLLAAASICSAGGALAPPLPPSPTLPLTPSPIETADDGANAATAAAAPPETPVSPPSLNAYTIEGPAWTEDEILASVPWKEENENAPVSVLSLMQRQTPATTAHVSGARLLQSCSAPAVSGGVWSGSSPGAPSTSSGCSACGATQTSSAWTLVRDD